MIQHFIKQIARLTANGKEEYLWHLCMEDRVAVQAADRVADREVAQVREEDSRHHHQGGSHHHRRQEDIRGRHRRRHIMEAVC